ncbi:MAG: hypothetical protein HRF40_06695 [Nitrososphaera sp.]|jgi:hypothetical protein
MVSEVISFIVLTAATIAASAIVTGYLATAASQTTARITEQTTKQILMTSESITIVGTYTCGSELCIDVMNNSGRQVGISYAYNGVNGNSVTKRLLDASDDVVSKLPPGAGTIALTPNTLTSAVLISENYVVYRIT